jgi:hypothetical protein
VRSADGAVLDVDPPRARVVAVGLRQRSAALASQRRVCDGIDIARGDPTVGAGLARFTGMWGSAAGALAHELDLLGVELGKSADAVAATDRNQVR